MNFALVEDDENGVIWASAAFDAMKQQGCPLDSNLSAHVNNSSAFDKFRTGLRSLSGPLILCVDRGLQFDRERRLAREYEFVDFSQRTRSGEEGIAIAIEAMRNKNISPLLVVVASSWGLNADALKLLSSRAERKDRNDVAVITAIDGAYFPLGPEEAIGILRNACEQYRKLFTSISPFEAVMDEIQTVNPADKDDPKLDANGHNYAVQNALRLTAKLLSLSEQETQDYFPGKITALSEGFKEMGFCPRNSLSIGSAWLIALSAFRFLHPAVRWTEIFDPHQLTVDHFKYHPVLPTQVKLTLRSSVFLLHTMFKQLFEHDDKHNKDNLSPNGPLLKAALGAATLTFELGFPLTSDNNDESMAQYLCDLVGRTGEFHCTSSAIWNFYLRSLLADNTNIAGYQFPGDCLRMTLRKNAIQTNTLLAFERTD